ncbi:DUF3795 domain-containing protein [bacterium]|nr:MAG: DUF3795 domain-containing protein [bacterium]
MAQDKKPKEEYVVAFCGLLCSLCRKYKDKKCPGCAENEKASWCKVRLCCLGNGYKTCAECEKFADPRECRDFDNFIARAFGMLFNSDRAECIRQIKRIGLKEHAKKLTESGNMTIPRR